MIEKRVVLGAVEEILIKGDCNNKKRVLARVDTGAKVSSIDTSLAAELGIGSITATKVIKSIHGKSVRPVIKMDVVIRGIEINADFTLIDRSHMSYPVLIGRNILEVGFLVDLSKK